MKINKRTQICVTGHEKLCPCPPSSAHQCTKIHKRCWSPPPSCAVTQTHTSVPSSCAQAYTNTELRTHARTPTAQSLKWRKKSHFPLVVPPSSGHSPVGGFRRHTVLLFFFLSKETSNMPHLKGSKTNFSNTNRQFLMKVLPLIPENGSPADKTSNTLTVHLLHGLTHKGTINISFFES